MALAPLLVLTDRRRVEAAGRSLIATVDEVLAAGGDTILLREKDLDPVSRRRLAAPLAELTREAGADLIVASDAALARDVGASGVHLAANDPWPEDTAGLVVGRSCHHPREVTEARKAGAHYVTLSPIFPTDSKPGYGPALGVHGLGEGCDQPGAPPVYALGGITAGVVPACMAAGAWGVAVMGEVMGATYPGQVVSWLLEAARD